MRDTITLWHLLTRVEGDDRARVYERMAELTPPPPGVTREGVLALDQRMLDAWKDKLELNWSDYSSPPMKFLRKAWARSLGTINGLERKSDHVRRSRFIAGLWQRLWFVIASTRVMRSYHLREQVDPAYSPQLECLTHPLTRAVLTSLRRREIIARANLWATQMSPGAMTLGLV